MSKLVLTTVTLGVLLCMSCGEGDSNDLFEKTPDSGGAGASGSGGSGGSPTGGSGGLGGSPSGGTGGAPSGGTGGSPTGGSGGTALCPTGTSICDGDVLKTCVDPQIGYATAATCQPGLCDAQNGQCDVCVPSDAECIDGVTAAQCDPTGQQMIPAICESSTPYCVGSGKCVECTQPQHCPLSTSECLVSVCVDDACGLEPVMASVPCGGGGTCDGNGLCTYCVPGQKACSGAGAPMQCDAQGQWIALPACAGSTPYCRDGVCVGCLSVNQCPPSGNECMSSACSANGTCGFTAKADGTPCSDDRQCNGMGACLCEPGTKSCVGDTPRTCSAAGAWVVNPTCSGDTPACMNGQCVECTSSYHCPTPSVCMTATCAGYTCTEAPSPYGTPCVGGACDGQGVCDEGAGGTGGAAGGGGYVPSYLEGDPTPAKCKLHQVRLFGQCFP